MGVMKMQLNFVRAAIRKWIVKNVDRGKGRRISTKFMRDKVNSYQWRFKHWSANLGSVGDNTYVRPKRTFKPKPSHRSA